jgi:hypothetical protein
MEIMRALTPDMVMDAVFETIGSNNDVVSAAV